MKTCKAEKQFNKCCSGLSLLCRQAMIVFAVLIIPAGCNTWQTDDIPNQTLKTGLDKIDTIKLADLSIVAVLSYHAWQRYYSLNPNVIGQTIVVNHVSATVIGVLPKDFLGIEKGRRFDVYMPLSLQPQIEGICPVTSPDSWWVQVMARLEPSVDEFQVSRSLGSLFTRTLEETGVDTSKRNLRVVLTDGSGGLSGVLAPRQQRMAKPLYLLFGLVGIVLLVTFCLVCCRPGVWCAAVRRAISRIGLCSVHHA